MILNFIRFLVYCTEWWINIFNTFYDIIQLSSSWARQLSFFIIRFELWPKQIFIFYIFWRFT